MQRWLCCTQLRYSQGDSSSQNITLKNKRFVKENKPHTMLIELVPLTLPESSSLLLFALAGSECYDPVQATSQDALICKVHIVIYFGKKLPIGAQRKLDRRGHEDAPRRMVPASPTDPVSQRAHLPPFPLSPWKSKPPHVLPEWPRWPSNCCLCFH